MNLSPRAFYRTSSRLSNQMGSVPLLRSQAEVVEEFELYPRTSLLQAQSNRL